MNVQRFWAGSLHSVEPDRLLSGIYVKEKVVFAKDYDTLMTKFEEAEQLLQFFYDYGYDRQQCGMFLLNKEKS